MRKLWKISVWTGCILSILCLVVMFHYGRTKSVVITEEHDLWDEEDLKPLTDFILKEKNKYSFVVLVNSAHGGENKGNVVDELQEKDITLRVGKQLEEMSQEGKIGIFLIRQEDIDISNESRAELIERVCPNLLIDLHVNADPENERTLGTSVVYNAEFDRPDLTNVELADMIERSLVTQIQGEALGVFHDYNGKYPLLKMVKIPAVSVEMGYLTNKQEAGLLGKEGYQEKIAQGIFEGIQKAKEAVEQKRSKQWKGNWSL